MHPITPENKVDYTHVELCQCRIPDFENKRRLGLLKYCELPKNAERCTFATFRVTKESTRQALIAAQDVAVGKLDWLTLIGSVDTGKSHLALAICQEWLTRGLPAKYIAVPRLLQWLREAYNHNLRGDDMMDFSDRMRVIDQVALLVLDDLGTEKPSAWATEQIFSIVDYRYSNGLPLVITTNKPLDQLPGDDDGRIASRLKRYENSKIIFMDAPEYRTLRRKGETR